MDGQSCNTYSEAFHKKSLYLYIYFLFCFLVFLFLLTKLGMLTVSMNRVTFKKPLFPNDVVEMRARVVYPQETNKKEEKIDKINNFIDLYCRYVRTHVLEVEIDVIVQRITGERIPSHSGYFIILNADEVT